jgi:hypothetical protein
VIFSPTELNSFYSSDARADLSDPNNLASVPNSSDLFVFRTVPFSAVKQAIRSIGSDAVGLDNIPLKFIKLFLPLILSPLTHIFNESISSRSFSGDWKRSKFVPVVKI